MTTQEFNESVNRDIRYMMENKAKPLTALDKLNLEIEATNNIRFNKSYALQVCNAGAMPDRLPESFEDWIKQGNDAIDDPGGNIIPSRVQSNHDQYDNESHPFA